VPIREGGSRRGALARVVIVLGVAAGALLAAPAALGATIEVTPGPNAIKNALKDAHSGDILRIHAGTYRESFSVNKRVTLRGVGGRPVIDSRCNSRTATRITVAGVTFDHLKVVGAAENSSGLYPSEVDVEFVSTGTIHDVVVHDTCGGTGTGAEYGINVFDSGPVEVSDNRAGAGFSDAGIYIGGITDTGTGALRVVRNATFLNHQGIIIENSAGGRIQVGHNDSHDNTIPGVETEEGAGIFIHNSDGVGIRANTVKSNGDIGVNIDSPSDHNRLIDNVITGNPLDLNNRGSANCGSGNTIGTRAGNPLVPC
jgi:nitrous oxidase accessory protein NosD